MIRAGLGYLAAADAAPAARRDPGRVPAGAGADDAIATAARAAFLAAFTAGQGHAGGRGLQRGVLADPPDRDHPRRRGRAYRVG